MRENSLLLDRQILKGRAVTFDTIELKRPRVLEILRKIQHPVTPPDLADAYADIYGMDEA